MIIQQYDQDQTLIQRFLELMCLLVLIGSITDLFAAEMPSGIESRQIAEEAKTFLTQEASGLGEVHVQVSLPEQTANLPRCEKIEAFLPPGARAQGKTTVGVRCNTPNRWTVFLQAQVQILAPYLVASHPLSAGQSLSANDLMIKLIDISEAVPGVINTPEGLYGNSLLANIPAGSTIRRQQVKLAYVVQSGQSVRLKLSGQGFQISGEGIALSNASEGQSVQVRTPRGSMVSGVARSGGTVELRL
jgi:flagella basal body P-ring formation protein FlgA